MEDLLRPIKPKKLTEPTPRDMRCGSLASSTWVATMMSEKGRTKVRDGPSSEDYRCEPYFEGSKRHRLQGEPG